MSRLRRAVALVGLAGRRVLGRLQIAPQRVLLAVLGVALAVGLMVTVTGISLGLASQSVVESEGVNYWIVPEDADVQSVAVSAGSVQLGDVHETSRRISDDDRVQDATPVLLELVPTSHVETGDREYLLAIGVVPATGTEVLGIPVDDLEPGDPHYAGGSYDGPWTGQVLLNDAAANLTGASVGSTLAVDRGGGNRSFTVANVTSGGAATAIGTAPVALVHLSELQAITGASSGDQADQVLVDTNDRSVRGTIADVYPRTRVITQGGLGAQSISTTNLPLAVAVAAFVAAVVVGVLFVTTLMGLEATADRQQLGALAAIGFTGASRSLLLAVETVVVSLLGGVGGVVLGGVGVLAVNAAASAAIGEESVAAFDPLLVGYAAVVAGLIGLVGAVYPVVLGRRADPLEVLAQ